MYFLPVLVGSSAAKFFGIDQYISTVFPAIIGGLVSHPFFISGCVRFFPMLWHLHSFRS